MEGNIPSENDVCGCVKKQVCFGVSQKIYQGKDIKKLEIKAEEMEGKGKKAYNYRIIMHI